MNPTLTRNEIKHRFDQQLPMTLVEALPSKYYDAAHLPGALNIPHDEVRQLAASLLPDKDAYIVVYCANTPCRNSQIATAALRQLGYSNSFEYVEGKQDWVDAGLPVEITQEVRHAQPG